MNDRLAAAAARSDLHAFFVTCGVAPRAAGPLWDVPGSSSVLAGSVFCNDAPETDAFVGRKLDKYVCRGTALELAAAAYLRAARGCPPGRRPVGLAATAAVASSAPRRFGKHEAYVASVSASGCYLRRAEFPMAVGPGPRRSESDAVESMLLSQLPYHVTAKPLDFGPGPVECESPGGLVSTLEVVPEAELRALVMARPLFCSDGRRGTLEDLQELGKPGGLDLLMATLNPLHEGHEGQLAAISRGAGGQQAFVVTTKPRHGKVPPSAADVLSRAAQVWASNARTGARRHVIFSDDLVLNQDAARALPGSRIAIGADALLRMLEPQWYPDGDVRGMLRQVADTGCTFRVFGREVGGRWVSAGEAVAAGNALCDPAWGDLFVPVTGRWDVSSSALRASR